jgi:Rnl2 family RNA ligase
MHQDRVPHALGTQQLADFCKGFVGKGTVATLVASPMLSVYPWLAHSWAVAMSGQSMPWGFSGVCARSFASGVLGVAVKELNANAVYKASHEGYDGTGYPVLESIGTAAMYTALLAKSKGQPEAPLTWAPGISAVPPQLPQVVMPELVASDAVTTVPFAEYPSITDPHFDASCSEEFSTAAGSQQWVATEKVHGANLAIISNGKDLFRCAKRTGLLTVADSEAFFNFSYVVSRQQKELRQAVRSVLEDHPAASLVSIVGEIAGGEYEHTGVPSDLRGTRVQKGVQYAPYNFFFAFDIAVMSSEGPGRWEYLSFDESLKVFEAAGLLHAAPLVRGSFDEVMAFSEVFTSTIPLQLGLPALQPPTSNFAEGLVMRPATREVLLPFPPAQISSSDGHEMRRVVIKRKHPAFREFSRGDDNNSGRSTPDGSGGDQSREASARQLLLRLVCANRLAAVASKCLAAQLGDPAVVGALVVADAKRDLEKMQPAAVACLGQDDWRAAQVCAEQLVNSADGRAVLAERGL